MGVINAEFFTEIFKNIFGTKKSPLLRQATAGIPKILG